jgi:hypothetical protein
VVTLRLNQITGGLYSLGVKQFHEETGLSQPDVAAFEEEIENMAWEGELGDDVPISTACR